jgi:predicted dehydrogenase
MDEVRLITLDPAHFHAALVQKEMYSGVSPNVAVYAPLGFDLIEHLTRLVRFNSRPEAPTAWKLDVHTSPDFLERMLKERPGNVAVLSGRNSAKIDRIQRCIESGLHVLADKPWILDARDLPKIEQAIELAEEKGLVAYDIMTERYEVTSLLQRELVNTPDVFGAILDGDRENPAVFMESVHRLMKSVAGAPSLRPAWFFDIKEQGEALADVGTHLVDLALWTLYPAEAIDYRTDIQMLDAKGWPTTLTGGQWRQVTGGEEFPSFLSACVKHGKLDYHCNSFVSFALRGVHIQMRVLWDFEGPPKNDTFFAQFCGTKSRVEVRQRSVENFRPEVYVVPNTAVLRNEVLEALRKRIRSLTDSFEGVAVEECGDEFRLAIPDGYRVGHEAHFGQVTRRFFEYLKNMQALPAWEKATMLAKYCVTTEGVELARVRDAQSTLRVL